ncbi:MAG: SPOR domain-containing protein [Proteobacteria bacterium]|nr:SPOR domain-containing protein [Pseudomonadota bacterium]
MNEILKQRLVGALILVALGVVFWPIIFVEQDSRPLGDAAPIPERPRVDTTPLEPPSSEGLRSSPKILADPAVELAEVPEQPVAQAPPATLKVATPKPAAKTRTEAPSKPALDADGVPIGWILQVASVGNPDKAEELRKRLIEMGYKAYVKKIKTDKAVLLRVYIGPKFERERLESIQPKVDAEFKVKSMVRRYIP